MFSGCLYRPFCLDTNLQFLIPVPLRRRRALVKYTHELSSTPDSETIFVLHLCKLTVCIKVSIIPLPMPTLLPSMSCNPYLFSKGEVCTVINPSHRHAFPTLESYRDSLRLLSHCCNPYHGSAFRETPDTYCRTLYL